MSEDYILPLVRESIGEADINEISGLVGINFMFVGNGKLYAAVKAAINNKWIPLADSILTHYAKYWPTRDDGDTMISDIARVYPEFDAQRAIKMITRTE